MVSQDTPTCLAAVATRSSTLAAYFLISSLCLPSSSNAPCSASDRCPFDFETPSQPNGSSTIITVTLAPTDFASDNPFVTACSANSDPSVEIRICRYMLHLDLCPNGACSK